MVSEYIDNGQSLFMMKSKVNKNNSFTRYSELLFSPDTHDFAQVMNESYQVHPRLVRDSDSQTFRCLIGMENVGYVYLNWKMAFTVKN